MARAFLLFSTILLLIFGSVSLSRAASAGVDKRDIVVDNAIGGMGEGSRIVSPDTYGEKKQIPKVPSTHLSPVIDTRVVADVPAGDAAKTGIFPGGLSSGVAAGVNEGTAGSGPLGGSTVTPRDSAGEVEPGLGGSGIVDSAGGSLIDVDASADLSSGSVDAGVSLDTENTDKILEADLSAGAGETGGVVGSADIAASDLSADSALPVETTESAISSETNSGTEVDTSGAAVGGEAEIGVEANVEGGAEGDDVANDPADGLPGI